MKKKLIIIASAIIIFVLIMITLFAIDMYRIRNNEPVLFSTWGYSYAPPQPIEIKDDVAEEEIENAIKNYIVENGNNENKDYENEKAFSSMRTYLIEEKESQKLYYIYAWVLEETYYSENDEIKQGRGSSIPYKFVVENIDGKFIVTDSIIPRDGSFYVEDMKNIFPSGVINDMDRIYTDGTMERLQLDIDQQTEVYFHK